MEDKFGTADSSSFGISYCIVIGGVGTRTTQLSSQINYSTVISQKTPKNIT